MVRQLRLNTLSNAKRSYNRIIGAYLRGELSTEKARTMGYLLTGVLQYWRLESDLRVEERLDAVEAAIAEGKK